MSLTLDPRLPGTVDPTATTPGTLSIAVAVSGSISLDTRTASSLDAHYPSSTLFPSSSLLPNAIAGLTPSSAGTLTLTPR